MIRKKLYRFCKKGALFLWILYMVFGPEVATVIYAQEASSSATQAVDSTTPTATPMAMPVEEESEPEVDITVTPTAAPTMTPAQTKSPSPTATSESKSSPAPTASETSQKKDKPTEVTPTENQPSQGESEILGENTEKKLSLPSFSFLKKEPKFDPPPKLKKSTIVYKLRKETYHAN